jgi:hypothetical protein
MATINQSDFIQSVADALQYISCYHHEDFITNLTRAYKLEESPASVLIASARIKKHTSPQPANRKIPHRPHSIKHIHQSRTPRICLCSCIWRRYLSATFGIVE